MNWYIKTIFAVSSGLENYLTNLGATPDIIQFIISKGKDVAQKLTDEFRKNRNLTIMDLQAFQVPQKDPYLKLERKYAQTYPTWMQKWILVNLRKLRGGLYPPDESKMMVFLVSIGQGSNEQQTTYINFMNNLSNIADWAERTGVSVNISSYTAQEAAVASQEWHKMMAGEGEGKMYEPTKKELIIYGPVWKKEEWYGWTIQKITSENDLLAEGNQMDNCVGDYCEDMLRENLIVYSLRDPHNNPHITLGTYPDGSVKDINGHSNQDPKSEYKAMVKEWITSKNNPGIIRSVDPLEELAEQWGGYELTDLSEALEKVNKVDEYGFKYDFISDPEIVAAEAIGMQESAFRSNAEYDGDIVGIPQLLIDATLTMNDKSGMLKMIKEFEEYLWKIQQETYEYVEQNWYIGEGYPSPDSYKTDEEYEEAREGYEEYVADEQTEWVHKQVKGGFANEGLDYIKRLREQKVIPSYEEVAKMFTKDKQL
jgi:hypothetical protein